MGVLTGCKPRKEVLKGDLDDAIFAADFGNLIEGKAPKVYGDGGQAYDFVYVEDCAAANVCAMKVDVVDRFYNVGTGKRTSIKELAELILKITGTDLQIQFEPAGQTFVKNRVGSPVAARKEIGFEAKVELEQGLRDLIHWRGEHISEVDARRQQARG